MSLDRISSFDPQHTTSCDYDPPHRDSVVASGATAIAELDLVSPDPALAPGRALTPDIGMSFTVPGNPDVFRVTGWLQRLPITPPLPTGDARLDAFLCRRFLIEHPEPNTEYRLIHCLREDATEILGVSTRGPIRTPVSEAAFTGAYAGYCSEEIVEADRKHARASAGLMVGTHSTLAWKPCTLSDALAVLPGLLAAFEAQEPGAYMYVHVNGHTVRGSLFVTDWDRNHGRIGPDYIWVDVAKRD